MFNVFISVVLALSLIAIAGLCVVLELCVDKIRKQSKEIDRLSESCRVLLVDVFNLEREGYERDVKLEQVEAHLKKFTDYTDKMNKEMTRLRVEARRARNLSVFGNDYDYVDQEGENEEEN